VSFIISSSTALAEEILIKGEAKYIGWQISKLKFITCHQYEIEIGDGKIEKTSEKCQKAPSGPSPLVIVGTVVSVHPENKTFAIEDEKGQRQDLFYRETIGTKVKLRNLKKGDKITVTSPVKGRAETIVVTLSDEIKITDTIEVFKNLKTVTVDAKANASNDLKNGWQKGKVLELSAGIWQIKGARGGWSAWPSDSQKPPNVKGSWTWNVYVKTSSDQVSSCYGVCSNWWQFDSAQDALKFVTSLNPYILILDKPEKVYFWIFNDGDIPNNRDGVTLEIFQRD
jgi:hypothetical protein